MINEAIIRSTKHEAPLILPTSPDNSYEDFDREYLDSIYETINPYSEMSRNQRYFLNGIIRSHKPHKVLEVGTSSGGGSAIILNAISDIEDAKLYSVDYLEHAYRFPDKPSGFVVEENFPELMNKWTIHRGGDVSKFIEDIGDGIDLLVLDTAHVHPWETLNFLCVLPFINSGSWTVLHDITLYTGSKARFSAMACRYLYSCVASEERISPAPGEGEYIFSNIGAFKVSELTSSNADSLFQSLLIPWDAFIDDNDIVSIKKVVEKHYSPEQYQFLCNAFKFQEYLREHPATFKSAIKFAVRHGTPKLFSLLKRLRHFGEK